MINLIVSKIAEKRTLLLYILLAGFLLFIGLNNNYFWDDEARTAVFARNVLSSGLPYGWDGKNLSAYENGYLYNDHLVNVGEPWLSIYVTAMSFYLFGINTFAGRLPFILASLGTIIIFYKFVKEYTDNNITTNISTLLLILSPSFILYSRQCRYYSLSIFLSVALFYLMYKSIGNRLNIPFFITSALLLFHSNILTFLAYFTGLIITFSLLFYKKIRIKKLVIASIIIGLYVFSWFLYLKPWEKFVPRSSFSFLSLAHISNFVNLVYYYFKNYNDVAILPLFYIILLPLIIFEKKDKVITINKKNLALVSIIFLTTIINAFISPEDAHKRFADIRYTINLMPLMCLAMAIISTKICKFSRIIGTILIILTIFTNIFCFRPMRMYLLDYLYEATHDYVTPYEAACDFMQKNIKPDDKILVVPDYSATPLLFYQSQFKYCGVLKEDNPLIRNKSVQLPDYIYSSKVVPDWIISFGPIYFLKTSWPHGEILDNARNRQIIWDLYVIHMPCNDCTRPELYGHCFYPAMPSPEEGIYIYKKISEGNQ